jgi:RNA polymerase sigma-70 factor (ECF subfamily)
MSLLSFSVPASLLPPTRLADAPVPAPRPDAGLVQRFHAGDETAFTEIVARHRQLVFHVVLRYLRNRADAEEIVQDTFIRAYRALAKFRGESSLGTWLYRIGRNLALNRYWQIYRRKPHLTDSLDGELGAENPTSYAELIASPEPDPARMFVQREFSDLATACMHELPDPQREILQLRNVAHLSYANIARTLGVKHGTVKSRLARARGNLHALLTRSYAVDHTEGASPWFESSRPGGWTIAA